MRGYQSQRQTISQLRQRDASSRNSVSRYDDDRDDDDDDDGAEFLQSNLRAHQYRKQQINTLVLLLHDCTTSFHCILHCYCSMSVECFHCILNVSCGLV